MNKDLLRKHLSAFFKKNLGTQKYEEDHKEREDLISF
jgi:hypothetical protein